MLVVAIAVTAAVVLLGRGTADSGPRVAGPSPSTPASPAPEASPPPSDSPSEPDDRGGGDSLLEGMLDDLLAGMDPTQLGACIGMPTGTSEPVPGDPDAAIEVIAEQVADERRLDFTEPIDPVLLSPDDLRARVQELAAEDYPAEVADVDARLLSGLGAIPAGTDLQALQLDLLGEQVAGFYDPDTGELTAVAEDGLDPTTRMTLAHEVDHALTDQALGLPDLDGFTGRSDEALATLAVIEGDASLLMQRWAAQQLSLAEQLAAAASSLGPAGQLQSTPWVLQQQLVFPYTAGLEFACQHFADGGWDRVDRLYRDGPTTSAQVLWPERYAVGESAVDVDDPALPADWQEVRRDQLGAADLLWLFQAPGDDRSAALSDPEERARAWAGGEVAVGTRDDDTAISITLAEHADATVPLCDSVTEWYGRAFPEATSTADGAVTTWTGPQQSAVIACDGDRVRLGIAPDPGTARTTVD